MIEWLRTTSIIIYVCYHNSGEISIELSSHASSYVVGFTGDFLAQIWNNIYGDVFH